MFVFVTKHSRNRQKAIQTCCIHKHRLSYILGCHVQKNVGATLMDGHPCGRVLFDTVLIPSRPGGCTPCSKLEYITTPNQSPFGFRKGYTLSSGFQLVQCSHGVAGLARRSGDVHISTHCACGHVAQHACGGITALHNSAVGCRCFKRLFNVAILGENAWNE